MTTGVRSRRVPAFFILVGLLIVGALVFKSRSGESTVRDSMETGVESDPDQSGETPAATEVVTWTGQLLVMRGTTLLGLTSDGTTTDRYAAPLNQSIDAVSRVADGRVGIVLRSGDRRQAGLVDSATGKFTPDSNLSTEQAPAPRPGSQAVATVRFSNAEADYGFSVRLVEGANDQALARFTEAVTALAWRSDGDELAVAVQNELTLIQLAGADIQTLTFADPIRSVSWSGSDVLVSTANGAKRVSADRSIEPLPFSASVARDLVALGNDQYLWLAAPMGAANVQGWAGQEVDVATDPADRIIGLLP